MIFDPVCKRVRRLFKPGVYSYCSPVQGRTADASTSVYEFDSVVRGQHVYKSACTPLTNKMRKCILWEDNKRDKYAVNNQLYQHPKGGCTHQERY